MQKIFEFSIMFVIIFFFSFTFLGVFGLLPTDLQNSVNSNPIRLFSWSSTSTPAISADASTVSSDADSAFSAAPTITSVDENVPPVQYSPAGVTELPIKIIIPSISLNDQILNPSTTDATVFDNDLAIGAVRYPTSGTLNTDQNIYLFGHSSYLKIVHNSAYRTFNGIQNLKVGDEIQLQGEETTSLYKVSTVSFLKDSQGSVDIGSSAHQLILSTCNVFAAKEDRVVVVANFVGSFPNSTAN